MQWKHLTFCLRFRSEGQEVTPALPQEGRPNGAISQSDNNILDVCTLEHPETSHKINVQAGLPLSFIHFLPVSSLFRGSAADTGVRALLSGVEVTLRRAKCDHGRPVKGRSSELPPGQLDVVGNVLPNNNTSAPPRLVPPVICYKESREHRESPMWHPEGEDENISNTSQGTVGGT